MPYILPKGYPHYSTYYSEKTKDMVAELYVKNIELFAYEFEDQ